MKPLQIIVVGPGRAGGSLALAAEAAGHRIVGVVSRSAALADRYPQLSAAAELPDSDLLVIATPDDHIEETAVDLAPFAARVDAVAHVSGFKGVKALAPFALLGIGIGSFHPLQTLPDPETGARSLAGAWAGLTASEPLLTVLTDLATSLKMIPFALGDEVKAIYHAAAASASNYVLASLDLASSLLSAASVPFEALEPLTRTVVANAFSRGPDGAFGRGPASALTGPIARGDWATVKGQFEAVQTLGPARAEQFRLMAMAAAITAGRIFPDDLL